MEYDKKSEVDVQSIDTSEFVNKVNAAIKLIEKCIENAILLKTDGEHILTCNRLDSGEEVWVSTSILEAAIDLVNTNQEYVLKNALKDIDNHKKTFPLELFITDEYKFVMASPTTMYVYHNTEYKRPRGGYTKNWLCCTEGWHLRADGKWHETINCGTKPDRIMESMTDVLRCYDNEEEE